MAGFATIIRHMKVGCVTISRQDEADLASTILIEAGLFACCKHVEAG